MFQTRNFELRSKILVVDYVSGIKSDVFPWRNWCLWTNHKHTYPCFLHSFDFKISCSMASHPSNNSVGRLSLDCSPRYFHQRCFSILHRRGLFHCLFFIKSIDFWSKTLHFSNFSFYTNFEPFSKIYWEKYGFVVSIRSIAI